MHVNKPGQRPTVWVSAMCECASVRSTLIWEYSRRPTNRWGRNRIATEQQSKQLLLHHTHTESTQQQSRTYHCGVCSVHSGNSNLLYFRWLWYRMTCVSPTIQNQFQFHRPICCNVNFFVLGLFRRSLLMLSSFATADDVSMMMSMQSATAIFAISSVHLYTTPVLITHQQFERGKNIECNTLINNASLQQSEVSRTMPRHFPGNFWHLFCWLVIVNLNKSANWIVCWPFG